MLVKMMQNLTVGPVWGSGVSRREAEERALHYLERVGLMDQIQSSRHNSPLYLRFAR